MEKSKLPEEEKEAEEVELVYQKSALEGGKWSLVPGIDKDQQLIDHLKSIGYKKPTKIQEQAIPLILKKTTYIREYFIKAPNGCGKTATFGIPAIKLMKPEQELLFERKAKGREPKGGKASQMHDTTRNNFEYFPQVVILQDTAILVQQTGGYIQKLIPPYLAAQRETFVSLLYGGYKLEKYGPILVATPRLLADLSRSVIRLSNCVLFAIDEAEQVYNSFKEELTSIFKNQSLQSNMDCKYLFLSATLDEVCTESYKALINACRDKPLKEMKIDPMVDMNLEGVAQFYFEPKSFEGEQLRRETNEFLLSLMKEVNQQRIDTQVMIFVDTKRQADEMNKWFASTELKDVLKSNFISSDIDQQQRQKVMQAFREQQFNILFCTNQLARGVDIRTVALIINIGPPLRSKEDTTLALDTYLHRVGRTGRHKDKGVGLTIFQRKTDVDLLEGVKKRYGQEVLKFSGFDVLAKAIKEALDFNSK